LKYILFFLLLIPIFLSAQDKRAYSWVFGGGGMYASFADSNAAPTTHQLYPLYDSKYTFFYHIVIFVIAVQGEFYLHAAMGCVCLTLLAI